MLKNELHKAMAEHICSLLGQGRAPIVRYIVPREYEKANKMKAENPFELITEYKSFEIKTTITKIKRNRKK